MARVILFHHALGLTDGVRAFADEIRKAGHEVETPDLYDGKLFSDVDSGVAYATGFGMEQIAELGASVVSEQRAPLVVAGFSLGVLPAQKAAQTLPGVVGAVFYHGAAPPTLFGEAWPSGLPLQMHLAENDKFVVEDLAAARELAEEPGAELFLYPTTAHLIADSTSPDYDAAIAATILERSLEFLESVPTGM